MLDEEDNRVLPEIQNTFVFGDFSGRIKMSKPAHKWLIVISCEGLHENQIKMTISQIIRVKNVYAGRKK